MLFNSLQFIIFFIIVVNFYYTIKPRYRNILLLFASYYFYMCWKPEYVILIMFSTLVDYMVGIKIEESLSKASRKKWLVLSLCSNLGLLFAFKYFNFIADSLQTVFNQLNIFMNVPEFDVLLPVGISFYTFQALSYAIDVYRGQRKAERNGVVFALYVSFFPQLVAGPIERSDHLLPQFYKTNNFNWERVKDGLRLMLLGFFKKIVLADNLALFVNQVYGTPTEYQGGILLLATYCFAYQIYFDFSGYSDIAMGTSRILGYDLMENFHRPYFATSLREFWKRWHISLSSWFKDYLYISLGGNHVKLSKWISNIGIVFLLSGLWHGANRTFIIWGAIHGIYYILEKLLHPFTRFFKSVFIRMGAEQIYKILSGFCVFHLVCFAWIFFRAQSLSDAQYIIKNIYESIRIVDPVYQTIKYPAALFIWLTLGILVDIGSIITEKYSVKITNRMRMPLVIRWSVYYGGVFCLLLLGYYEGEQFIYFQF